MENHHTGNPARVLQLLLRQGRQSRQSLATALGLSVPTVAQCAAELCALGLAYEDGSLAATGGRKARLLAADPTARVALGLDITQEHVTAALVDLAGEVRAVRRERLAFAQSETYFSAVAALAEQFLAEQHMDWAQVPGVGISIPGIVSADRQTLEYSHVLHVRQFACTHFSSLLPRPCSFLNDAKAAAASEFWDNDEAGRALYLSLSNSVGGAIIRDGQIVSGNHHRAGEFGHMTLIPDGRQCYCGQYGCVDAYCSAKTLTARTGGDLDLFFAQLRGGEAQAVRIWQRYEQYLAATLRTLLTAFDCPVFLGGYVGTRMEPAELASLREAVGALSTFELEPDAIRLCRRTAAPAATGAALTYIRPFLETLE